MSTSQRSQTPAIYLARNGQTFGPYTAAEIDDMKKSGKFFEHEWYFDGTSTEWQRVPMNIAPPPPPPQHQATTKPQVQATPQPKASAPRASDRPSGRIFQAICHDFKTFLSGQATQVTQSGCELVIDGRGLPDIFGAQSKLFVDLLDEKTDRSVTIKAQLVQCTKRDNNWVYIVQWDGCPLL